MDTLFEIIAETIITFLFSYPGTFFIWLFQFKRKSFKEVREQGSLSTHTVVGIFAIISIIMLVRYLLGYSIIGIAPSHS